MILRLTGVVTNAKSSVDARSLYRRTRVYWSRQPRPLHIGVPSNTVDVKRLRRVANAYHAASYSPLNM